jgi:glycosyltransferase involved in cell wall biosynthesis
MIAVIIPYFKIDFFRETLLSLANQVDDQFHVYICDDNSPDNPQELLSEFEGRFSFTYHKFTENFGSVSLVKQWKRCLDLINGEEWSVILGDDDVLETNVIQDFYHHENEINGLEIDVIRFSTVVIDENNQKISNIYTHPVIENSVDSLMRKIENLTRSSLSEYIFRTNNFNNYTFKEYPSGLFSDDILILNHASFKNIYTINSSVIQIRKSKVNLSGGAKLNTRHVALLQFYKTLLVELKENFNKQQISYIEYKLEREVFNHVKISILLFLMKYYFIGFKFLKLTSLAGRILAKMPKLIFQSLTKKGK